MIGRLISFECHMFNELFEYMPTCIEIMTTANKIEIRNVSHVHYESLCH